MAPRRLNGRPVSVPLRRVAVAAHRRRLRAGDVPSAELVVARRAAKRSGKYDRETPVVGALRRAADRGIEKHPGETVRYVHVADAGDPAARVRLPAEVDASDYAAAPYDRALLRAAESVVSPLGWDADDVRTYLRGDRDATLAAYCEE